MTRKQQTKVLGEFESDPSSRATVPFMRAYQFSRRESDVFSAATRGLHTKAIARELMISEKTVEYFWRRIFTKTGCSSKVETVLALLRFAMTSVPAAAISPLRFEDAEKANDGLSGARSAAGAPLGR